MVVHHCYAYRKPVLHACRQCHFLCADAACEGEMEAFATQEGLDEHTFMVHSDSAVEEEQIEEVDWLHDEITLR